MEKTTKSYSGINSETSTKLSKCNVLLTNNYSFLMKSEIAS